MAVTSQARPAGTLGEVRVKDWQAAGLIKPSAIKPVITTVEQALVIRRLGRLKENDQAALRQALAAIELDLADRIAFSVSSDLGS